MVKNFSGRVKNAVLVGVNLKIGGFFTFSMNPTKLSSAMKNLFPYMSSAIFMEYIIGHKLHTYSIYPLGQNGGQEFFGSSEECCSSWSGCCNSSCAGSCGDQQPLQQKLQDTPHQQPLSAAMVVMQVSSSCQCSLLFLLKRDL